MHSASAMRWAGHSYFGFTGGAGIESETPFQHAVVKGGESGRIGMVSVTLQPFHRGRMVFDRVTVRIGPKFVLFQHRPVRTVQPCGVFAGCKFPVSPYAHREAGSLAAVFAPSRSIRDKTEFIDLPDHAVEVVAGQFRFAAAQQTLVVEIEIPVIECPGIQPVQVRYREIGIFLDEIVPVVSDVSFYFVPFSGRYGSGAGR